MKSWWIEFEGGSSGCCSGVSAYDAKMIAEHVSGKISPNEPLQLPYPARPTIWAYEHPIRGVTPPFCHSPEQCKGRSSCPNNPSCTS